MIVVSVLVIALLGFLVYQGIEGNVSNDPTLVTSCADSTGALTIASYSALSKGTNITPTLKVGVNGGPVTTTATSGTTTFAVGDKLKIHASLSDYIDTELDATMKCGGVQVDNPMFYATSDNPSVRIKNDDGDFVTDNVAGSTTNQTNLATGETLVMDVEFQGTNLESSGDLIYVIELPASTSANVTDIIMAGAEKVNLPNVHTTQNAGSKVQAFRIPAIVGADKKSYAVSIVLGAGKDLAGGVYTDWYAEQKFIDTDGTIKSGVQDADGTAKYENTGDFDFYINSA